jgi:hypothetical protein
MWKTYPQILWNKDVKSIREKFVENLSPKNVEKPTFQHKRAFIYDLSTLNVDKFVKKCAEMRNYI